MSRYRKIDPRIWNDAKFVALSDNAKLVFFMLLTHPNMTALGAMRATLSGLAEELGWSVEAFREAFREATEKGMVEHDQKACLIALPKFIQYNPPESPNVIKAWASSLDLLPECALRTRVITRFKDYTEGLTEGFRDAFGKSFGKTMPNQEQEQEQEQEKETAKATAPPSSPDGDPLMCPVDELVEIYHEAMPNNPRVKVLNEARRGALRARWREAAKLQCRPFGYSTRGDGCRAWRAFFETCNESAFLTGRVQPSPGRPPFLASLDFLLSPSGFANCLENKYHREVAA
jgi:hypothetical protein